MNDDDAGLASAARSGVAEISDVRLSMAVEAAEIGAWYTDLRSNVSHGTRLNYEFFGLPVSDVPLPTRRWFDRVHADDRERVRQAWDRAVATRTPYRIEFRVRHADGTVRWLETRGRFRFDGDGNAIEAVGAVLDVTEDHEQEIALLEARGAAARELRPYEAILANTPDLAYIFDLQHRFVYANEGLLRMWGRSRDEALGKTCLELGYEPWHAAMHDREIDQVVATKRPIRGEVPFTGTYGRRIYDYIFVPVIGPGGEVEAVAGTTRDVTEYRDAQRALEASEAALVESNEKARLAAERVQLALAAGAIIGTWDWDVAGNRITADERFAESFGLDPRALETGIGVEAAMATVHPDDLRGLRAAVADAFGRGGPYRHQYRVRRRDGRYHWIEANGRVDLAADGSPTRFPGVLIDIGERRAIEAERDRAMELLRAFTDAVPGVVYAKDRDGRMLVANRGTAALIGKPSEQFLGKTDMDFLEDKRQAAGVMANDRRVMEGGKPMQVEEEVSLPDGTRAVWLSSKAPFRDARGTIIGLIGSSVDITARKEAEEALQAADRRKDEFLAMLAHELRNPLAPIVNAAHVLKRETALSPNGERSVAMIDRQARQMKRLVDDLLEVSRVTQGRIKLRKENILAASAIYAAIESARPLMRERDQHLEIDVPSDLEVVADHARLTQIVANFLDNAAKYTQTGGHIQVRARACDGWAEISVTDDGPGIDAQLLPHVFDLFAQGNATLDRARGGLGLGLALVKRLIELHGGSVSARSGGPGRGSVFTARIPLAAAAMTDGAEVAAAAARPTLNPCTILVVDDNVDAAESLADLLRADGHVVRVAADGEAALTTAKAFAPAVVLLDIGLPKMDGWAVATAMRADALFTDTVIIALTGYGQSLDRARSRAVGLDAHLLKPAELETIYRTIAELRPGP